MFSLIFNGFTGLLSVALSFATVFLSHLLTFLLKVFTKFLALLFDVLALFLDSILEVLPVGLLPSFHALGTLVSRPFLGTSLFGRILSVSEVFGTLGLLLLEVGVLLPGDVLTNLFLSLSAHILVKLVLLQVILVDGKSPGALSGNVTLINLAEEILS